MLQNKITLFSFSLSIMIYSLTLFAMDSEHNQEETPPPTNSRFGRFGDSQMGLLTDEMEKESLGRWAECDLGKIEETSTTQITRLWLPDVAHLKDRLHAKSINVEDYAQFLAAAMLIPDRISMHGYNSGPIEEVVVQINPDTTLSNLRSQMRDALVSMLALQYLESWTKASPSSNKG